MTIEDAILAAFPAEQHKPLRIALLKVVHAGENAQHDLDTLDELLGFTLDDPAEWICNGVLAEGAEETAKGLRRLAGTLETLGKTLEGFSMIRHQVANSEKEGFHGVRKKSGEQETTNRGEAAMETGKSGDGAPILPGLEEGKSG